MLRPLMRNEEAQLFLNRVESQVSSIQGQKIAFDIRVFFASGQSSASSQDLSCRSATSPSEQVDFAFLDR